MYKIVVLSGGRDFRDQNLFNAIMGLYITADDIVFVGDCPSGLDEMARLYCENRGIMYRVFRANWRLYGRAAGPRRNAEMCRAAAETAERAGVPVQMIGFPGGRGTASCAQQARRYNIPAMLLLPRL